MSVDRNSHIGVFLIVDGEIIETTEECVNTCSNNECNNHKSNKDFTGEKFCSSCGSKVAPKIYKHERKIDAYRFLDNLIYEDKFEEDELCWTDSMGCGQGVFIPNYSTPFDLKRKEGHSRMKKEGDVIHKYDDVTDLTVNHSTDEIFWFKEKYEDLINLFRDNFGKDNVRVGWGVVEWYS